MFFDGHFWKIGEKISLSFFFLIKLTFFFNSKILKKFENFGKCTLSFFIFFIFYEYIIVSKN